MKRHSLHLLLFTLGIALALPAMADWDQGVTAFREGRYADAAEVFQAYVQQQPDTPAGHFMLAQCRIGQKRIPEALASLERAVELEAGNPDYRLSLAKTQLGARRADAALTTLAAMDPSTIDGQRQRGYETLLANVAASSGETRLARSTLQKALRAHDDSKVLWQAMVEVAGSANPEDQAEALLRVYALDPSDAQAGRDAIRAALSTAQRPGQSDPSRWYRAALPHAQAMAAKSGAATDQVTLGETHLGLKELGAARTAFEAARTKEPNNPRAHYYLATVSLAEKDAAQTLEHLKLAETHQARTDIDRFPELVQLTRASALRHLERFVEAAEVYDSLGRSSQAAEMRNLRQAQLENDKWAEDQKDCQKRRDGIRQLMADSEDLKGTPEWENLEQELDAVLQACDQYLNEAS